MFLRNASKLRLGLHAVTFQKRAPFIVTLVRTSDSVTQRDLEVFYHVKRKNYLRDVNKLRVH